MLRLRLFVFLLLIISAIDAMEGGASLARAHIPKLVELATHAAVRAIEERVATRVEQQGIADAWHGVQEMTKQLPPEVRDLIARLMVQKHYGELPVLEVMNVTVPGLAYSVAFSPDGNQVATGGPEGSTIIWETETGQRQLERAPLGGCVSSRVFRLDGDLLLAGYENTTVFVVNVQSGKKQLDMNVHHRIRSVVCSPNGSRLAVHCVGYRILLLDAQTGGVISSIDKHIFYPNSLVFSSDEKRFAVGIESGAVCMWDVETAPEEQLIFKDNCAAGYVEAVAFSRDGRRLAAQYGNGFLCVWDVLTGESKLSFNKFGYPGCIYSLVFSPDGKRLAAGGIGGTVYVLDAQTGADKATVEVHWHGVRSIAFSADGTMLTSGLLAAQCFRVWRLNDRRSLPQFLWLYLYMKARKGDEQAKQQLRDLIPLPEVQLHNLAEPELGSLTAHENAQMYELVDAL